MSSVKNSNVTREVERLLAPLRIKDEAKFNIVQALLDDVYKDPTLSSPESTSKEIEDRMYKMIDDHIRFNNKS